VQRAVVVDEDLQPDPGGALLQQLTTGAPVQIQPAPPYLTVTFSVRL
jgi:hypothetical protein